MSTITKWTDRRTGRRYVKVDGVLCHCVGCLYQMGCLVEDMLRASAAKSGVEASRRDSVERPKGWRQ